MRTLILPSGNLRITANESERAEMRQIADKDGFDSDDTMVELFEPFIANSEFDWVKPEDIGVLTSAPILGLRNESGEPTQVWGWMNYQVQSLQRALMEQGKATLLAGN